MSNKETKVSVIIVNWNRKVDTLETLSALAKSNLEGVEAQIIVVDNASTDGSVEAIKKLLIKNFDLKIIRNSKNLAFAAGNNVGIRPALDWGADFVLLVNNDLSVNKNTIVELLAAARQFPRAGAIAPKIYFAPGFEYQKKYKKDEVGKVLWYAGGDIDWDNVLGSNHGVDEVDEGQYERTQETDFATGACVLYRAEALREVGMFDEKFFLYLEDADLSMRLKKAGWSVLYFPGTEVWHKVAQSSGSGSELNDYFITRNRLIFGLRYAPLRAKLALLRESIRLLFWGRKWQKIGIRDFYLLRLGRGSWSK